MPFNVGDLVRVKRGQHASDPALRKVIRVNNSGIVLEMHSGPGHMGREKKQRLRMQDAEATLDIVKSAAKPTTESPLDDLQRKGVSQREFRDLWNDRGLADDFLSTLVGLPLERCREVAACLDLPDRVYEEPQVIEEPPPPPTPERPSLGYTKAQLGNKAYMKAKARGREAARRMVEDRGLSREDFIALYDRYTLNELCEAFGTSPYNFYVALGAYDISFHGRRKADPDRPPLHLPLVTGQVQAAAPEAADEEPAGAGETRPAPVPPPSADPIDPISASIAALADDLFTAQAQMRDLKSEEEDLDRRKQEIVRELSDTSARMYRISAALDALEAVQY